jgi:tetratricopeptide (TPR) repeat protein
MKGSRQRLPFGFPETSVGDLLMMKRILAVAVFGTATLALTQDTATPAAQPSASTAQAQASSAAQAPVIKDPVEYNDYIAATGQKDAEAEISALEAFQKKYPNSVMKPQLLDVLLGLYQQSGNPKVADTARQLLAVNPDNAKALVVLAFNERGAQNWADAKKDAEQGLEVLPKWTKPDGVSDADFAKQKTAFNLVLENIAGLSALQLKDYASAQKHLRTAVEADPNNVENVYPLALALLPPSDPADLVNGIFFMARAVNLVSDPTAKTQWKKAGRYNYVHYHGSDEGWNDLLTQTATTPLPPAGFTIKPAPTPQDQAHDMVTATAPDKMDFAQWEFVLSSGSKADQDLVWNAIKGKAVPLNGTVIKATATEFDIAGSLDDIDDKKADITLTFETPVPKALIPKEGASLNFQGEPASYTSSPFMMTMEKGLLAKSKVAPKPKPASAKKTASAN